MKDFSTKKLFAILLVITMIMTSWDIPSETVYAASKTVKSVSLKIGAKSVTKKTFKKSQIVTWYL